MAAKPLSETHPALAAEWHPTRNPDLTPDQVSAGSNKKVWWLGKCGHEWHSTPNDRKNGYGCPYCSGRYVLKGFNDLESKFPKIAKEWHSTLNGDSTPDIVSAGSGKRFWWICEYSHEWESTILNRTNGSGCPYCSRQKVLTGVNDLLTTHPALAAEWHPTLNGDSLPSHFIAGSGKKVWWLGKCGHEWEALITSRALSSRGCGYCSGKYVLKGFNDLATKYPNLAKEWHPTRNPDLTPDQVSAGSNKKVWWLGICGHEWEALIPSRALSSRGCGYCSLNKLLIGFNDLETRYPELAAEWHPTKNGSKTPRSTMPNMKEVWWLGKCGHEWRSRIQNRTLSNSGCPKCSNYGFSSANSGYIYFIQNKTLGAHKVGISNSRALNNRLEAFQKLSWTLIKVWENESGLTILSVEKQFFQWLRKDKRIPRYLSKSDLLGLQGASETFSDSILTQAEVIAKIEELLAQDSQSGEVDQ
jgi:hypothetical protein